jgi:hypothetical protein
MERLLLDLSPGLWPAICCPSMVDWSDTGSGVNPSGFILGRMGQERDDDEFRGCDCAR